MSETIRLLPRLRIRVVPSGLLARRLGSRPATAPHDGFRSPPAEAAAPRRIMAGAALGGAALHICPTWATVDFAAHRTDPGRDTCARRGWRPRRTRWRASPPQHTPH